MAGAKGKYNKKIANKIAELYSTGEHGVKEICIAVGIHIDTFYSWKKTKPEFAEAIDEVLDNRLAHIGDLALSGLAELIKKQEFTEERIEYETFTDPISGKVTQKVKSVTRTKKIILPNNAAIQYALNNVSKDKFRTASSIDHTTNGGAFGFAGFLMGAIDDEPEQNNEGEQGEEPENG